MATDPKSTQRSWLTPRRHGSPAMWAVTALICTGGVFAALRYGPTTAKAEVPVARVRVGDFAISIRSRGEIRSVRSDIITAPQVPDLRIVSLAEPGMPIKQGEVVVEFELVRPEPSDSKSRSEPKRGKNDSNRIVVRAPHDGIVSVLPNFRRGGSSNSVPPPFREGDLVWTGAAVAEIPDLSTMRLELNLEEVDRGRVRLNQPVKVRVDAFPDRDFNAILDWISPVAAVAFKGMGLTEKAFPAYATLRNSVPGLKPGMVGVAQIVTKRQPSQLLIPIRASFTADGNPAVYLQKGHEFVLRPIEVGQRNETDIVVLKGLDPDDMVALENPSEPVKRARKSQ